MHKFYQRGRDRLSVCGEGSQDVIQGAPRGGKGPRNREDGGGGLYYFYASCTHPILAPGSYYTELSGEVE